MASRSSCKRALVEFLDGNDDDDAEKLYRFQILLPNGTNTRLTLHDPGEEMFINEFLHVLRKEVEKSEKFSQSCRRKILWNEDIYLEDMNEVKITKKIRFNRFRPNKCHILKLHDGAGQSVDTFHNMWDLTPDTDLLQELPADYTFETALADLIDNSLQAVWSNATGEKKLISVTVEKQRIVIFDSGPGMDGRDDNSITKWGKMGSSNHRPSRRIAIGGKAPYLMPFFGMFGYGGPIASMHLGRHATVSSKTKESKKVYTLHLSREALMKKTTEKCIWRADGGIRDPSDEEMQLSPHGSFTKVEICDLKMRCMETSKLQCLLKDIYFPYIQCDEEMSSKKTTRPIEFQVNHTDLAEIEGGEVAITNLHSCNGPDFVFQLHLVNELDPTSKTPGSRSCRQANARLKCVYFPIVEGKESIDRILEKLAVDGFREKDDFEKFSRLSIRRLGRLLPDARWQALPFMEPQQKRGDRAQLLRRCCHRVKCFVDTDAGFSPTPSKTDLAHHDPFTLALRSFGSKPCGEDSAKIVEIHKDGKPLNLLNLEKEYHDWIFQMHDAYDEEAECGEDEPVLVIGPCNKKKLGISADVVRVHKIIRRKGLLWKSGQKVKILKGAVGCSKNNLYATLEYFLLEGFQGDVGGEARIICRLLGCPDEKGCLLVVNDGNARLDVRDSQSFPISEIDNGKIHPIDDAAWNYQLGKKEEKAPSRIDILTSEHSSLLNIMGELPLKLPVQAGYDPPDEIVAVIRPACFTTSNGKGLEQKYILKDDLEMSMEVRLVCDGKDFHSGDVVIAHRAKPTSRNGFHGLYIFSLREKRAKLFCKAGVYIFSFSVICRDLSCKKREVSVTVKPASSIGKWKLHDKAGPLNGKTIFVRVGSSVSYLSVACFDEFGNPTPFSRLPELKIKVIAKNINLAHVEKMKMALSSNQLFMEVRDVLFESCKLDMIRPSYEAALEIYSLGDKLMAEVPCRVMPGPLSSINMQCSSDVKQLSPGTLIREFVLEALDVYGNHIEEGVEFPVQVDGLCFVDHIGSTRKVNDKGYINLNGLLKVTAGYGSRVRVFVCMAEKMIFEKIFQVVERELRVVSGVPSYCPAGTHLKNVVFGIFDSVGAIDVMIHGHQHTLTIKSESSRIDDTVQYTFKNGRCIVPFIPVPVENGPFRLLVSHTQNPDLCVNIEVQVVQAPKLELVPITDPDAIICQSQCSNDGLLSLQCSSQCLPSQMNLLVETIMDDVRNFDVKIQEAGLQVRQHEDKLKILNRKKDLVAKEICYLEGGMEPQYFTYVESVAHSKGRIMEHIEGKRNTAAAVFCNLCKAIQSTEPQKSFMKDYVGIVAFLGTVSDSRHSSIFAEYLGKDYMLAVVCKSYEAAITLEKYGENGKVTHNSFLHEAATTLGITINRRFPVLCLEEVRPYKGDIKKNDLQRKLALPKPLLPSGKTPAGFLGYAVNMIHLDVQHLNTRTSAGYGLRETLFYRLFGETQVYDSREHLRQANACIKHGALSLDGGIMKDNGIIFLGDHEPDVRFPVVVPHVQGGLSQQSIGILEQIEEKRAILAATCEEINEETEAHTKALAKFRKHEDKYRRFMAKKTLVMGSLLHQSPQFP